jgi:(p)ppGpp synthase/HD superfamily hydrolase
MDLHKIADFAFSMHYGQNRKHGNLPYIVHPMDVMHKVANLNLGNDALLGVALCHDILEDCQCEQNDIDFMTKHLGDYYSVVEELTFSTGNKDDYLASFRNKSIDALIIKMADRVCNVLDFRASDVNYSKKYFAKAKCLEEILLDRKEEFCNMYSKIGFDNLWNLWSSVA